MTKRRQYDNEFKRTAVELAQTSEKAMADIERELSISAGVLKRWMREAKRDEAEAFPGNGRLMRQAGICAIHSKRRRRGVTTQSNHDLPVAANVLNREFTATMPNQKWVTDIIYIPTAEGWLYLAIVLDLFSRKVVGWVTADRSKALIDSDAT